jgi:dihydrofolate synthase/folylpolyglutamate synthase
VTQSAVEFLFSLERFGMKFGLENIARLCEALGHPERTFASVIVGGTNGKGSVTAMVDTALRAAGHRSGRYTSPHLQRLEERFAIDGREVAPDVLERTADRVRQTVMDLVALGSLDALPTFFECTTAIAFELFREANVRVAVLEVGLGGRLDATNIVSPIAAALVSIDFDHQAQLGTTLASIAAEKAGIVKPGIPVVCGPLPDEAMRVVADVCAERGATLIRTDADAALARRVAELPLSLAGDHQRANAAVAVRLLEAVDGLGIRVAADAIRTGLTTTVWPGRLEAFIVKGCRVLLDAAHNPAGARALAAYLARLRQDSGGGGATLVFGAMKDKAAEAMLAALAPAVSRVICTTAANPRALTAGELAAIAERTGLHADAVPDPVMALADACGCGGLVVVAGSIFLIGPVRERLRRDTLH